MMFLMIATAGFYGWTMKQRSDLLLMDEGNERRGVRSALSLLLGFRQILTEWGGLTCNRVPILGARCLALRNDVRHSENSVQSPS